MTGRPMTGRTAFRLMLLALACAPACPGSAWAANAGGSANAEVVAPAQIQSIAFLRFGTFVRPATAGTETVATDGGVSGTGGMAANLGMTQTGTGRGPARFQLNGSGSRLFLVQLPNQTTISSGSATMQVDNFTSTAGWFGLGTLNAAGQATLDVGGRLNVSANQAPGNYTGTFTLTVYYL